MLIRSLQASIRDEAKAIIAACLAVISFKVTDSVAAHAYRKAAGTVLAGGTIAGADLFEVFEQARKAGATLGTMDDVRKAAISRTTKYDYTAMLRATIIVYTLAEQGNIITSLTFPSRDDADQMLLRIAAVIEDIKMEVADILLADDYRNLVELGAAITQHLSATERKLPKVVNYTMGANLPSLAIADRLYADPSRSDELIAENRVVHPAFFPLSVRAISQ